MKKSLADIPQKLRSRKALIVYVVCVGLFLLVNLVLLFVFRSQTFPGAKVSGRQLGIVSEHQLADRLHEAGLLPDTVTLIFKDKETLTTPAELGISVDTEETVRALMQERSWLPLANLFIHHDVPFSTDIDQKKLDDFLESYTRKNRTEPTDAKLALQDGEFSIVDDKPGYALSKEQAATTVIGAVASGQANISIEPEVLQASITKKKLTDKVDDLKKRQRTKLILRYKNASKTFTPQEIAVWYDVKGASAELSDSNIRSAIVRAGAVFGITVQNLSAATAAAKSAVNDAKSLDFALQAAPKPTRTFTYCVATKGVSSTYLGGFASKLASTYADKRGWGLGGQVKFAKVASNCDFTAWLAEASQVPTFGSVCDSTWSCRVGRNVIINFTRWQNASPAWNTSGGSLDSYRAMVINHETGHWFGFGHSYCGGAGQAASVMQQQSIDLQGCNFNSWPLAGEQQKLRSSLGL